eukprot:729570_1
MHLHLFWFTLMSFTLIISKPFEDWDHADVYRWKEQHSETISMSKQNVIDIDQQGKHFYVKQGNAWEVHQRVYDHYTTTPIDSQDWPQNIDYHQPSLFIHGRKYNPYKKTKAYWTDDGVRGDPTALWTISLNKNGDLHHQHGVLHWAITHSHQNSINGMLGFIVVFKSLRGRCRLHIKAFSAQSVHPPDTGAVYGRIGWMPISELMDQKEKVNTIPDSVVFTPRAQHSHPLEIERVYVINWSALGPARYRNKLFRSSTDDGEEDEDDGEEIFN